MTFLDLLSLVFFFYKLAHLVEFLELCAARENDESTFLYFEIRRLALAPTERTNTGNNSRALDALGEAADEADCVLVVIFFDFCVYRRHRRYLTIKKV